MSLDFIFLKKTLVAAAAVTLMASCGDDDDEDDNGTAGPFALTFTGSAYTPHDGQVLSVIVIRTSDSAVVAGPESATVSSGTFNFSWPGVLAEGQSYELRYYVDFNGGSPNGDCDAPPADHGWTTDIPTVTEDVSISDPHDTSFSDVCASFGPYDVTLSGTGYAPHDGQNLSMTVVLPGTTQALATPVSTTVSTGTFSLTLPNALWGGRSYELRYYADFNSSGSCDAPPTDHAWAAALDTVTGDLAITDPHDTGFTDVCASF